MDIQRQAGIRRRTESAFTLIEMLAVIAIIAILAGMLMPALGRARHRARMAAAMADIRGIETAMEMYADDFNRYPADQHPYETTTERELEAGWSIIYHLSEDLTAPDGTTVGPYLEFDTQRVREQGDYFVYMNPFGTGYYRFRNNVAGGDPGFASGDSWNSYVDDWDVCYVNRSSVDIWTDDGGGEDFIDFFAGSTTSLSGGYVVVTVDGETYRLPTWENLRGQQDIRERYRTISNW